MTQTSSSLSHPIALDYENTLVLAIELSNASWVLAAQVPGLPRVKAKQTIAPKVGVLARTLVGTAWCGDARRPALQCSG